jgi:hypothetical protein
MRHDKASQLKLLEGRRVRVALRDGSRIDDAQLVSSGRGRVRTLWVFTNGVDAFVPLPEVVDVWEVVAAPPSCIELERDPETALRDLLRPGLGSAIVARRSGDTRVR